VRPSGKINLIAVVLLGALAYGLWWVVMFSGVYLDNLDIKDAVNGAYNESSRASDGVLISKILSAANSSTLGEHDEDDGYGTIKSMPGLGLKAEDITIARDDVRKTIKIAVEYQRKVLLKPTKKVKWVKFKIVKEGLAPN
jgi:hypothetical protein